MTALTYKHRESFQKLPSIIEKENVHRIEQKQQQQHPASDDEATCASTPTDGEDELDTQCEHERAQREK